jgi:hypothetical protein
MDKKNIIINVAIVVFLAAIAIIAHAIIPTGE